MLVGILAWGGGSTARAAEDELVVRPLSETDANYGHLEYVPPGYETSGIKHPVIVFLHGAGESGDGESNLLGPMTAHGPGKLIEQGDTYFADHDMLLFIPQSPGGWNPDAVHEFIGHIAQSFRVDPRQVYLTGLSMGVGGTWTYVANHPGRISSAVPICGAAEPGNGEPFADTPVWAFHSWGDPTVTRSNSVGWVDNIADATFGGNVPDVLSAYPHTDGDTNLPATVDMTAVYEAGDFAWSDGVETSGRSELRLTLYADNAHDSWTRTYDEPTIWDWLVGHQKPSALDDDTYIVDNLDAGVTFAGDWSRSQSVEGFYWWDAHESAASPDTAAIFTADLPAGAYEVFLSWTAAEDHATEVDVTIAGSDESVEPLVVDMTSGGGFASLGELTFSGGSGTVSLRGVAGIDGLVVADAVGFVPVPVDPGGDTGEDTGEDESDGGAADESGDDGTGGAGPDNAGDTEQGDGSTGGDGTGDDDGGAANDAGGGCGCRTMPVPASAGWLLLAGLGGLGRRRRARRSAR